MSINNYEFLNKLQIHFENNFNYLSANIPRQYELYGENWAKKFDLELKQRLVSLENLKKAASGYAEFAMDSLLLTAKFQKTKKYDFKTYEEAANEVYQSYEYMNNLYLPGILLSHYLWKHHYQQYLFYLNKVVDLLPKQGNFYDVGVGTGFYSRNILRDSEMCGFGIDMSPHSLNFTRDTLKKFSLENRYSTILGDFYKIKHQLKSADFICSIEVLEHLENPLEMLQSLFFILKPNHYGLISAAVNAPNADHIYLYKSCEEVARQIKDAGFDIIDETCDEAYEPRRPSEIVPVNYGALVQKK